MKFYSEILHLAKQQEPFLIWVLDPLYFKKAMAIIEDTHAYDEEEMVDVLMASKKIAFYDKNSDSYYMGGNKYLNHPFKSQLVQYVKLSADDGDGYIFFINNQDN
jgi:hypothetical protein